MRNRRGQLALGSASRDRTAVLVILQAKEAQPALIGPRIRLTDARQVEVEELGTVDLGEV